MSLMNMKQKKVRYIYYIYLTATSANGFQHDRVPNNKIKRVFTFNPPNPPHFDMEGGSVKMSWWISTM